MTFNFLSCLIVLARTSSTILIRSGQREHPYLVYNFRGKDFSFSLLSMMLTMVLPYIALSYCSKFLLYLRAFNLLSFYHGKYCCCAVIQSCLTVTPWTAACKASLPLTIPRNLFKLKSIESVMSSNPLILCHPLLL